MARDASVLHYYSAVAAAFNALFPSKSQKLSVNAFVARRGVRALNAVFNATNADSVLRYITVRTCFKAITIVKAVVFLAVDAYVRLLWHALVAMLNSAVYAFSV